MQGKPDKQTKWYLAGPMSGHPQFNYPAFDAASDVLRAQGFDITSPAEMDDPETRKAALNSVNGIMKTTLGGDTWGDFLARDLKMLADTLEGIILLPEWETSKGARLEVFVAIGCGYPVRYYINGEVNQARKKDVLKKIVLQMVPIKCTGCGKEFYRNSHRQTKYCSQECCQDNSRLQIQYGITKQDYITMLEEQGGVCKICKGTETRNLSVDHCHTHGHVRGLLCINCNVALGKFKDDPTLLEKAIDYLKENEIEDIF